MKPAIWNYKPLNLLGTLASQTLTFPVLTHFRQDTCNSLARFFLFVTLCECRTLNFKMKTSAGVQLISKHTNRQTTTPPQKKNHPKNPNTKTPTQKITQKLVGFGCHFKVVRFLFCCVFTLENSHKFRLPCQKDLLPFLRISSWFWPNYKFLKSEFLQ